MLFPPAMHFLIGFLFLFHFLFIVLGAIGVVFLLAWAIKQYSAQKLKTMGLWFLGVGIVGGILLGTLFGAMANGGRGMMGKGWMRGDQRMMQGWDYGDADYIEEGSSASSLQK